MTTATRDLKTISVAALAEQRNAGRSPRLLDVRSPAEFAAAHVPGAINVPLGSVSTPVLAERYGEADAGEPLYVICQSGGRSEKCGRSLIAAGHGNVVSVRGGTGAWAEAGYDLVRGASGVISLERHVRIAAGALVVTGVALGWWVHPAGYALAAFVGAGLGFAGVTDTCGMGLMLARLPWNRRA